MRAIAMVHSIHAKELSTGLPKQHSLWLEGCITYTKLDCAHYVIAQSDEHAPAHTPYHVS